MSYIKCNSFWEQRECIAAEIVCKYVLHWVASQLSVKGKKKRKKKQEGKGRDGKGKGKGKDKGKGKRKHFWTKTAKSARGLKCILGNV